MKYTYGYDPASFLWIVGHATEFGTIAKIVASFAEASEAAACANALNDSP